MDTPAVRPTPRWPEIVREQFLAIGIAARRDLVLVALVLGAVTLLMLVVTIRYPGEGFDFVPEIALPVVLLGLLVPMAVWKGEEPSRRSYLWAMPVDRARHTLVKVLDGWLWFMLLVAGYLLWGLAMALLTGGDIGVQSTQVDFSELPGGGGAAVEEVRVLRWNTPAWQWLAVFTGATVAYLIGSIVVISSDHPWRWYAGVGFVFFLLVGLTESGIVPGLGRALQGLVEGRLGLEPAVVGMLDTRDTLVTPAGQTVELLRSMPSLNAWAVAMPFWILLGAAGVVLAAYRHQER